MKESIEQNIKQSLEQHEMPYNSAAWTAMSAKLDAKMPVSPKSNFKYYIAASAIVVVAIASYFAFNDFNSETQKDSNQTAQVIENNESNEASKNSSQSNQPTNSDQNNEIVDNSTESNEEIVSNEVLESNTEVESINTTNTSNEESTVENSSNSIYNNETNNTSNSEGDSGSTITTTSTLVLPKINAVCAGDIVMIENKNDEPLVVEGNDLHFIIPAQSSRNVRIKSSGNHTVKALNGSTNQRSNFFAKELPAVDFTIDSDTKFDSGIPSTMVESTVPGQSFSWIANGQKSTGRTSEAHFFDKGNHDITLTVTGSNGCKASETKSIYIEEKYNLMAVNSFMPASNDSRKNRFMPYALTQRDVQFNLIIIDPIDGHVVYQTKDASAGWDGIDSKTGSMVSYESAYIWKVVIENPELNENNEYVGNIIPIDWR